jgi:hypothetical protein
MAPAKKTTARKAPAKKTAAKKPAPRRTQAKYYRNLRQVPVGLRLEESDRKIQLAARGQRGDVAPLKKGEQNDPIYLGNVDMLFEVITKEEADAVIEKQATNIQEARSHPAWDTIRRPDGEEYDQKEITQEDPSLTQGKDIGVAMEDGQIVLERQGNKGVQIKRANLPGSDERGIPKDQGGPLEEPSDYLDNLRTKTQVEEPTDVDPGKQS